MMNSVNLLTALQAEAASISKINKEESSRDEAIC